MRGGAATPRPAVKIGNFILKNTHFSDTLT